MGQSWDENRNMFVETPQAVVDFLDEIQEVCRKHDMSISHEDGWGGFVIERYSFENIQWLREANLYLA